MESSSVSSLEQLDEGSSPSDPDIACWRNELTNINRAQEENACLSTSPVLIKTPQPRTPSRLLSFTALLNNDLSPTSPGRSFSASVSRAASPHSCLQRSRSTSSDSSTTSSSRSVRFTESEPKIKYTWPKEVYDRAPIHVDEDLRIKRCPTQAEDQSPDCPLLVPKPRTWVVDSYSELVASNRSTEEEGEDDSAFSGYSRDGEDDDDADTRTIRDANSVSPAIGVSILPEINEECEGARQSSHDVLLHLGFGSDDEEEEDDEVEGANAEEELLSTTPNQHSHIPRHLPTPTVFSSSASSDSEDNLENLHPSSSSAASCEDEDTPLPTPEASPAPPPEYYALLPKCHQQLRVNTPNTTLACPATTGSRRMSNRSSFSSSASSDAKEPTFVRWDIQQQAQLKAHSYDSPVISPSASSSDDEDEERIKPPKTKRTPSGSERCSEAKKKALEARLKRMQALANKDEYTCLGGF